MRLKTVNSVKRFFCFTDYYVYQIDRTLEFYSGDVLKGQHHFKSRYPVVLELVNDRALVLDFPKVYFGNVNDEVLHEQYHLEGRKILEVVNNCLLCVEDQENHLRRIILIDRKDAQNIWAISDVDLHDVYILNDVLIYSGWENTAKLVACSLVSGQKLWEREFEREIFGQLKLGATSAIVSTIEGEIISLELATGKLLWKKTNYPCPLLDKEKEQIYTIQGHYNFTVLDSANGNIVNQIRDWSHNRLYPNLSGAFGGAASVYKDFIVIPNNDTCEVFFLNKETAAVVDYVKLDVPQRSSRQEVRIAKEPIYHQGKLFVLDSENTLHIYERDEHIG